METTITKEERQRLLESHRAEPSAGNPALYVGTYGKYAAGSIAGMWVDLSTFDDYDEFEDFCVNVLHADEPDPELMYQDYENMNRKHYSECCFDEATFNEVLRYSELCDEYGYDAVDAYLECGFGDLDDFTDHYDGEWDSKEDFAESVFDELYLHEVPEHVRYYIDYAAFARDLFCGDYYYEKGHVFH